MMPNSQVVCAEKNSKELTGNYFGKNIYLHDRKKLINSKMFTKKYRKICKNHFTSVHLNQNIKHRHTYHIYMLWKT